MWVVCGSILSPVGPLGRTRELLLSAFAEMNALLWSMLIFIVFVERCWPVVGLLIDFTAWLHVHCL